MPSNEHYFTAAPQGDFRPTEVSVRLAGQDRSLLTAGGVFSPEHLDRGTELLVNTLAASAEHPGTILDLGCGWGPIALDAALTNPDATVWAVDVNERARELTRLNAERLGLSNVRVAAPEDVPDGVTFHEIRSNPPIRVGKDVLHTLLQTWLARLAPDGIASLVVAKHLGANSLERWIAEEFPALDVERVARKHGFHIIQARSGTTTEPR